MQRVLYWLMDGGNGEEKTLKLIFKKIKPLHVSIPNKV